MTKLTPIQEKALVFIRKSIDRNGIPPTLREICSHMGYSAIGSAQDLVAALRKKGYLIANDKQTARGIIPTDFKRRVDIKDPELFVIPCLGTVPAGNPVDAVEEQIATLRISRSLLPKPTPKTQELFAVQAQGTSMIGAGILDGDWLVVKATQEAPRESIVVARVDGEVTVKRLKMDKQLGWFLQPENRQFKPIYSTTKAFSIIGQVVALQRSLP